MQRNASSAAADRSLSLASADRARVGAELNLVDPAEIFRRLDRKPRPRPLWMTAVAVAVLALAGAGGVIAFQDELRPAISQAMVVAPASAGHS